MTNGEIIQKVFNCEVCEPIIEDDIIHVIFSDKNDSAIGFDWSWWNMEYKESTTKNNLGVDLISRADALDCVNIGISFCDVYKKINDLPSVTPQEPMVIPIAEFKFDKDKLKELVDRAVLTVIPQEPTDKIFTKAELDSMAKAINYGWELRVNEVIDKIRAEIAEYGSIWVQYQITGKSDRDIEQLVIGVLKQAKEQVLEIIDKYKAEIEPQEDEE